MFDVWDRVCCLQIVVWGDVCPARLLTKLTLVSVVAVIVLWPDWGWS